MKIIFDSALVMKNRRQGHKPVSSIFGKAHGKDGPFGTDKHLMQAPELSGAFFCSWPEEGMAQLPALGSLYKKFER